MILNRRRAIAPWSLATLGTAAVHGVMAWLILAHPVTARLDAPRLDSFEMIDLPPPRPVAAPVVAPPPPEPVTVPVPPPPPVAKPMAPPRLKPLPAPVTAEPAPSIAEPVANEPPPAAAPVAAAPVAADVFVPPRGHVGYANNPPPVYPPAARRMGREGLVVLRVEVGADGHPTSVIVFRGSGSDLLDQAARRAVEAWRFAPATRGGRPVGASTEVPIRFRLDDP